MKKVISIMLAVLMLFSVTVVVASATDYIDPETGVERNGVCTCDDHFDDDSEYCNCCLLCSNLNPGYKTSCVKWNEEQGYYEVCCRECTGVWPCDCGCDCCKEHDQNYEDNNDSTLDDYWGEEEQKDFVSGFQAILKQISDVFDKIFDAIFEFLRLDEVLGRN